MSRVGYYVETAAHEKQHQFVDECSLCSDKQDIIWTMTSLYRLLKKGQRNNLGRKTNSLVSMASQQTWNQQMTDCSVFTCMLFIAPQQHPCVFTPGYNHSLLIALMCLPEDHCALQLLLFLSLGPSSAKGINRLRESMEEHDYMLAAESWRHKSKHCKIQGCIILCSDLKDCIIACPECSFTSVL